MPKIAWAAGQADSGALWLPVPAPRLPARIPVPLHLGEPDAGYPWRWAVVPWMAGSTPPRLGCGDVPLARDMAAFARALRGVDPAGGPVRPPGTRRGAGFPPGKDSCDSSSPVGAMETCLGVGNRHNHRPSLAEALSGPGQRVALGSAF